MKLLVIGGAGFIGSNTSHQFAKQDEVVIVDNLSRPGTEKNLNWLNKHHRIRLHQKDIRDAAAMDEIFKLEKPDAVIHLAAQVAVTTSVSNPREDFEINALGTFNLLEATRKHAPDAAFIYASTNKVYGGMEDLEIELKDNRYQYANLPNGISEDRPLDFHSPYGCSKGAADQYVRDYHRMFGLKTVVCRQSCIYGQRQFGMEDQGWVAWFALCALQGRPFTVYGDGKQIRDVLYIDDLVQAYRLSLSNIDKTAGQILNLGGGPSNQMSLLQLISMIESELGQTLQYGFSDWRPGDQRVFVSNVNKAQTLLGWSPKTNPSQGVKALIDWIKTNPELFTDLPSLLAA